MLNRNRIVLLMIALVSSIPSCDLIDKKEKVPAWIQIDHFTLQDNPEANEGSLSHNITDAWVYINEDLIGIFELPAKIPILESGSRRLLVGPGIKVSTQSDVRDNYLFYEAYETNVNLASGETTVIDPVVRYRSAASTYNYILVENFEDGFLEVQDVPGSEVNIERTTDPSQVFEGKGSGLIAINDTVDVAGLRTSETFELPTTGKAVFLEMDYYSEYGLTVGVHIDNGDAKSQTIDYLTLRPDESGVVDFKKVYISLESVLAQATYFKSAYIYFLPLVNASDAPESGIILLDNIKIMHQL